MGFKPRQRRVTVYWTDAATSDPWQLVDAIGLVECATTGYIVEKTAEYIKVASSVNATDDLEVSNVSVIPRGMIRKVERLPR